MSSPSSSNNNREGHRRRSNVIWWDDDGKRRRVGKLLGLQGYSSPETTFDPISLETTTRHSISKNFLYNAVASFLASKHFNERRGSILPHLPELLQECDFYWNYEYRDGQFSALEATRQLLQSLNIQPGGMPATVDHLHLWNTTDNTRTRRTKKRRRTVVSQHDAALRDAVQHLEPFAISGAFWSRVSNVLSVVTGGLGIPYMTGGSTAAKLGGSPLFARTIPSNDGDARAAMLYYKEIGIRHVAVLFIRDQWGIDYHSSLRKYGSQFGIAVRSFAYDPDTLANTMKALKASQHRYIFGIMRDWKAVMREAMRLQIVNRPEYVWIAAEEKKWTGDDFQLEIGPETDLAAALHGVGTINLYFEPVDAFETAMDQVGHSKELQQEFIQIQAAHPEIFDNYTWPKYDPTGFAKSIFDSVLALGITACNASNNLPPLFTGTEFHEALLHTQFEGVTGEVRFDPNTGSRIASKVKYSIENVYRQFDRSDSHYHHFDSHLVAVIHGDVIQNYQPFLYNDGGTIAPPAIPLIEGQDLHLIPPWAMGFAYALAAMVMIFALVCGIWCYVKRTIFVLSVSQPFFLIQLCAGCFLMAAAVFPWALPGSSTVGAETLHLGDETEQASALGLNVACMSSLWLGFVGFATAFSSLSSKILRINQILDYGSAFRRAQVGVASVMMPLYVSLSVNIVLLLCITFVSPLHYARLPIENNVDMFGRSPDSYGTCTAESKKFYYFLGTLVVTNLLGVMLVTRESYKASNIPPDFSDRESLARALLSILETVMLGGPILLVVEDNPTTFFLVGSSLLSICCLTILLLIFIPKYMGRNRRHRMQSVVHQIHSHVSKHSMHSGVASGRKLDSNKSLGDSSGRNMLSDRSFGNYSAGSRRNNNKDSSKSFGRKAPRNPTMSRISSTVPNDANRSSLSSVQTIESTAILCHNADCSRGPFCYCSYNRTSEWRATIRPPRKRTRSMILFLST